MSERPTESRTSALQDALVALKKSRARLEAVERARTEPIAIVGMACRFPGGATTPEAYWCLLRDGKDAITEVPRDRWDVEAYYSPDPEASGKMCTRWGGFLDGVDAFDPSFFGISGREAASMDPQQRLILETCWEAIEHAGQAPDKLAGTATGVFIGISSNDYTYLHHKLSGPSDLDVHVSTGNAACVAAGRVSYILGLHGPALALDTACSSSLVAVHLACASLRAGECTHALAGGVNLILSPELTIVFSKAGMMARDGRCKTFDAAADGYVRSEGCGVVVLKRLSDAVASGDRILALVRGTAVNQDGRSSGLTAPNGKAQEALLRRALANAGLAPSAVGFVETHGTGTPLGDPIEIGALAAVFGPGRGATEPVLVGAVKSNVGHLEAAAGIAGLIKTVLILEHGEIPPDLHFRDPNPHIPWADLPIAVAHERRPWARAETPRIAGVSSFGFSGTNAHVILEEAPPAPVARSEADRPEHLLCLSAKTEPALVELARAYEDHLATGSAEALGDVAFTANGGRSHFTHRLAVTGATHAQMAARLAAVREGRDGDVVRGQATPGRAPRIAFLFTGQGSQYAGMGRQLWETQATFRRALEECDALLRPHLDRSLLSIVYAAGGEPPIDQTAYTQPALFALEYALARLWQSWGIQPAAVMGHSIGEYVAACIAGVFELPDALRLVAARGRLMQALPQGGAMAAVEADEAEVAAAIEPYSDVSIAAVNGPASTVISGAGPSVTAVMTALQAAGRKVERLNVSHAFHSPLMEPILEPFAALAGEVRAATPRVHLVANVTGRPVTTGTVLDGAYWREHVRAAVRFQRGVESLRELGCDTYLEVGPSPVLLGMARRCLADEEDCLWLPSLRKGRPDWSLLLDSVARLYVHGGAIDWEGFDRDYRRRRVTLPTYPFQRRRYWLAGEATATRPQTVPLVPGTARPAASGPIEQAPIGFYEIAWKHAPRGPLPRSERPRRDRWLVLADGRGVGAELQRLLEQRGESCTLVSREPAPSLESGNAEGTSWQWLRRIVTSGGDITRIVHFWSLDSEESEDATAETLRRDQERGCASALALVQALASRRSAEVPRAWYVTRGVHRLDGDGHLPSVAAAALWGLGRVIALEQPESWGGLVDVPFDAGPGAAALLLAEIDEGAGEDAVALRDHGRYVPRLVRREAVSAAVSELRADGSYLITGGLGALGLRAARWLVERGARHLVLVGRNVPSASATEALAAIERAGARVVVAQADVSRREDLARALAEATEALPPLRGVIHAAGVLDDGPLVRLDWARFERVLAPKVAGAWNLHVLTRGLPLDFFVLFSSAASLLGAPAQANYAAANAFLDALAHHRKAAGLPAASLNWGAWAGAGMSAAVDERQRQLWRSRGLELLDAGHALGALGSLMAGPSPQVGVMSVSWARFAEAIAGAVTPPLLRDLLELEAPGTHRPAEAGVLERFRQAPEEERARIVQAYLQQQLSSVLDIDKAAIQPATNLLELGMDSLLMMEVISRCQRDLKLRLFPREIYERPTFDALCSYLADELVLAHGLGAGEAQVAARPRSEPPPSDLPATEQRRSPSTRARNPRMVFVLSSPRAGSTLLRVMLAGHPQLFCPPELHLLPFETMKERERGLERTYLGEGLLRAVMAIQGSDAEASGRLVAEWLDEGRSVQDVYAWLQAQVEPRLLVDKSPSYGGRLDVLRKAEALFDGAQYVFLTRHPYAVIESFVRNRMEKIVGGEARDAHDRAEQVWFEMNQNIASFLRDVDPRRQMTLAYEELVAQPARVGRQITDFLGLPWDEAVLKPYEGQRMTDGVRPGSLGIGDPNLLDHDAIDPSLGDAWRSIHLPRPLEPATCRLARELGYELPNEAGRDERQDGASAGRDGMTESVIEVRGRRLCVCSWGKTDAPAIVCLHGMLDQGAVWDEVASALARQGYRVLAPDLRGHGRSGHAGGPGGYRLIDYVSDLDAVLGPGSDGLLVPRNERAMLVGHSMGASVAGLFAALRPERVAGLVLIESLVPREGRETDLQRHLRTQLDHIAVPPQHPVLADLSAAADRLCAALPFLVRERALRFAERATEPCTGGVRWRWDPWLLTRSDLTIDSAALRPASYLELLRQIEAPVALVHGPESRAAQKQLEAVFRGAESFVVPGGHSLHLEAPGRVAELVGQAATMVWERQEVRP